MGTETTMIFADRLQDLISASEKSIKELAAEIGISSGALSKYQNDAAEPGIDALKKIADYFGVSPNWLLGVSEFPNEKMREEANEMYDKLISLMAEEFDENDRKRVFNCLSGIISGFKDSLVDYDAYTHYENVAISVSLALSTVAGCLKLSHNSFREICGEEEKEKLADKVQEILYGATFNAYKELGYFLTEYEGVIAQEIGLCARSRSTRFAWEFERLKESMRRD